MKLLTALALATLVSCTHSDPWAFNRINSGDAQFNSSKLTFYSKDPINGIDLELMQTPDHVRTYLNVHSISIPPSKDNPKTARVVLVIGADTIHGLARLHEGGQRLLLPPELAEPIIAGLMQKKDVQIKLPGYSTTIAWEGFEEKFKLLGQYPRLENPFHLPF